MDNYDEIISLGYVCNVPALLSALGHRKSAYPFDRVATPMWAVYDLLENNFDGFLDEENITSGSLFDGMDNSYVYDSRYYTRIADNCKKMNGPAYDHLIEKIREREQRFLNELSSGDSILFIRSEEPSTYSRLGDRIILPEHANKYAQSERYYLELFSDLLKVRYPSLQFKILLLSSEGSFVDATHNIVGIPLGPDVYNDIQAGKKMKAHIDIHQAYIDANL